MIRLMPGDLIFEDSDAFGAQVVKYLMRSPNLWIDLWRIITGTLEKVDYYHPTLVISDTEMIEQQWRVRLDSVDNINHKKYIVFRPHPSKRWDNSFNDEFFTKVLIDVAKEDIGQKWGIIHTLFGRFPTWLTGIPYFARYVKLPNEEVSAGRVARWMYEAYGETFGHVRYTEATTHTMVKWMLAHPEKYEIIERVG